MLLVGMASASYAPAYGAAACSQRFRRLRPARAQFEDETTDRRAVRGTGDGPLFGQPTEAPDEEDAAIVLGARVLGAGVGGFSGNRLWAGIESIGLSSCTPFTPEGCSVSAVDRARRVATPVTPEPSASDDVELPFGLSDILRNPTSILPQEWNLEGRKYMDSRKYMDAAEPPAATSSAPPAVSDAPPPAVEPPPALSTPTPPALDADAKLQELQRLQEQIAKLQSQQLTSSTAPVGVPPASASEPAELLQLAHFAPSTHVDSGGLLEHHGSLLEHGAGFAALAESGGVGGLGASALATLLSAALGALFFEYLATTSAPPAPDPLASALWAGLHGPVRAASKLIGTVARMLPLP